MIVVATSEDEVLGVRASLDELRVHVVKTVAAGESRPLVFAAVDDERQAEPIAVTLRAGGVMAVVRPDRGPSLDAWMRHTEPVRFGDRLSVCFAWSEYGHAGLSGLIELGPGGFGNGEHPATRLLVELLLERVAPGQRVLDVGCGSGVLGLCALRLGAARVVAVDIKEAAIAATRRNAALNGMSGWMQRSHRSARSRGCSTSSWRTSAGERSSNSPQNWSGSWRLEDGSR